MGCGTGCVGIALAREVPRVKVWGVDILPEAVHASRENARRNGLPEARYTAIQSDLFGWFCTSEGEGGAGVDSRPRAERIADVHRHSFDLIVCNPPYLLPSQYDALPPTVKHWESRLALVGDAYRESKQYLYFQELCEYGVAMLKPDRLKDPELRTIPNLVFEVGLQAELVASLMEKSKKWTNVEVHLDDTQQPRWITAISVH
ncbi:unnamed protein product [Phytomonas sp. EM1]|nr:unnamed protein product [Phytomonas sp. EM1]|eukprot:CCW63887.1 unnamed protein product [Phytomonas sp. isolate EM1]